MVGGVIGKALLGRRKQVDEITAKIGLELKGLRFEVVLVESERASATQVILLATFCLGLRQRRPDVLQDAVVGELRRVRVHAGALVATSLASGFGRPLHQVVHIVVVG